MATSDLPDPPTAPPAGATSTGLVDRSTTGLPAPAPSRAPASQAPPGQVRPVHDDLGVEPVQLPADEPAAGEPVVVERAEVDQAAAERAEQAAVAASDDLVVARLEELEFARPTLAGARSPRTSEEDGEGRGTPRQAMAGWGAALVLGAACWAGALAVVSRVV